MGFIPIQVEDVLHLFIGEMMQHIKNSMISNLPKLVVILNICNSHLSVSCLLSAKCTLILFFKISVLKISLLSASNKILSHVCKMYTLFIPQKKCNQNKSAVC
jgi:uncharacterized membrane protein YesL